MVIPNFLNVFACQGPAQMLSSKTKRIHHSANEDGPGRSALGDWASHGFVAARPGDGIGWQNMTKYDKI